MRVLVMIFLMLCAAPAAFAMPPVIAGAALVAGLSTGVGVFVGNVLVAGALKYFAAHLLGNAVGGHSNRAARKRRGAREYS
jgi:hypothetical protein